jgi:hypothetical protein
MFSQGDIDLYRSEINDELDKFVFSSLNTRCLLAVVIRLAVDWYELQMKRQADKAERKAHKLQEELVNSEGDESSPQQMTGESSSGFDILSLPVQQELIATTSASLVVSPINQCNFDAVRYVAEESMFSLDSIEIEEPAIGVCKRKQMFSMMELGASEETCFAEDSIRVSERKLQLEQKIHVAAGILGVHDPHLK